KPHPTISSSARTGCPKRLKRWKKRWKPVVNRRMQRLRKPGKRDRSPMRKGKVLAPPAERRCCRDGDSASSAAIGWEEKHDCFIYHCRGRTGSGGSGAGAAEETPPPVDGLAVGSRNFNLRNGKRVCAGQLGAKDGRSAAYLFGAVLS